MGCRHTFIQQAILKEGDASLANVLQCAKMLKWQNYSARVVQNARTNDRPHNRPYSTGSNEVNMFKNKIDKYLAKAGYT